MCRAEAGPARTTPTRTVLDAEQRRTRQELNAAAKRVTAELGARRTAHDPDGVERSRLDQIEECVDAAALRAIRVADSVDEDVDLVAGEAADEYPGHRRARLLQADARLAFDGLRHHGGDATGNVLGIDDADWLADSANAF